MARLVVAAGWALAAFCYNVVMPVASIQDLGLVLCLPLIAVCSIVYSWQSWREKGRDETVFKTLLRLSQTPATVAGVVSFVVVFASIGNPPLDIGNLVEAHRDWP